MQRNNPAKSNLKALMKSTACGDAAIQKFTTTICDELNYVDLSEMCAHTPEHLHQNNKQLVIVCSNRNSGSTC
jgi:hypothetical protein